MDNKLQYSMYVLAERHLSPLDKGIQSAHAICEYYNLVKKYSKNVECFDKWSMTDKTIIVLNGGTVIDLNETIEIMHQNDVDLLGIFREIDLGNIVTAVSVLVDERVFDHIKYPDFEEWCEIIENKDKENSTLYDKWVTFIGGKQNVFLRNFLNSKKLAR